MKLSRIFCAALVALAANLAFSLDGREVMQKAYDVAEPKLTRARVQMDLIDKGKLVESRVVDEWGRSVDGVADAVMLFRSPASVKGTAFLQKENKGRDDDKWIYMPSLKTTRKIASSDGGKSFMGTDATYDDMSTREVDEDTHELLGEETKNGFDCNKVKSTPKDAKSSQYQYRISWVDKKTSVPVFIEMYDKKGKLVKTLTVEKLENVGGYDIPMTNFMENVQTGHSTRLQITNIKVDGEANVNAAYFQSNALEKLSAQAK